MTTTRLYSSKQRLDCPSKRREETVKLASVDHVLRRPCQILDKSQEEVNLMLLWNNFQQSIEVLMLLGDMNCWETVAESVKGRGKVDQESG